MRTSKAFAVAAALVTGSGIVLPSAQAAAPAVRYVSPSGSDAGACLSRQAPCATINYAVTQAASGDTVRVGAGHYAESVTVATSLDIVGAGVTKTVVSGDGTDPGFSLGNPKASTTDRLTGLSVTRTKSAGIVADDVRLTLSNVASDRNYVGADVAGGSLVTARSSFSHSISGRAGSGISGFGVIAFGTKVSMANSAVDDNASAGVVAEPSLSAMADGNTSQHAFAITAGTLRRHHSAATAAAAPALTVRDSSISGNHGPGIAVLETKSTLTDDTLADNAGAALFAENTTAALTQVTITGTKKYKGRPPSRRKGALSR